MNKKSKRLFLFASYDKYNCVDDMLLHYLNVLSTLGDVVFVMDNPLTPDEIEKITNISNILYVQAERHGEYDFGSYKRAYQWARGQHLLSKYDWVYFVNDSVLGPVSELGPVLENLETQGKDVVGMFNCHQHNIPEHIQSWFIGITGKLAQSEIVSNFMARVRELPNKDLIIQKYEIGFSQLLKSAGYDFASVASGAGSQDLKGQPGKNVLLGVPFFKKSGIFQLRQIDLDNMVQNKELLEKINFWLLGQHIELAQKSASATGYRRAFDFKLFNCVPVLRIYRRNAWGHIKNKYVLFGFLPMFSITRRKAPNTNGSKS